MILTKDLGGYIRDKCVLEGSFRIDGTDDPDAIYDGNSNIIDSVVRESAGLFTVTFASVEDGGPSDLPEKLVCKIVTMDEVANPVADADAFFVLDSYSQATRSFQIGVKGPTDGAGADSDSAPIAVDPDDDSVINFYLCGSISSSGTD